MEPLSFPPPPPAPSTPQRAGSVASSYRSVEPSLDEISQEISQLKADVDEIDQSLQDIELLRDQVVNSELPASQLLHPLKQLSSATTTTGVRILGVSAPLVSASTRLAALSALAAEGKAAATSLECSAAEEELEVLKLSVKEIMERVRSMAFEEMQGRVATRARWETRIRSENAAAGEDIIQMSVQQALSGLDRKVAELDVESYAGRCAAEHPYSELAAALESAKEIHRTASIHSTASSATAVPLSRTNSQWTFVGSSNETYGKLEGARGQDSRP